ncbi:MAG: response regulator [Lachnospiraceae bacterium]|nr:response regulator [Lachnospiraceae bacterium]
MNQMIKDYISEIEEQKKIAENANKAKSYFLASMSHEIRTPINTILGMDEMILRESTDSAIREYAMDIRMAGRTLLSIINDILDLSKIEAGKMEIVPAEYSVPAVIADVENMIRFRAEEKGLEFRVKVSTDIPSGLYGDDIRIKQILMNLLTNAVKYTRKGSVELRVSLKEENKEEDSVLLRFEVEDTGVGIKLDEMVKLFSNFQRIGDEHNRNVEGTGLGVPITMKLLKLMDSELQLKSEYGKGSRFYFDLRQKVTDETPVGDYEENIKNLMSENYSYAGSFTAPEADILLVDDNSMNRKVFVSLLKQTKIRITEADNGIDALKLASVQHFDIIFMDHMMPGMDGIETMKRIKEMKDGPCAATPVIILTANAVAGMRESYLEDGFDGYLSKPVSGDKLENTVKELLPGRKVRAASDGGAGKDKGNADLEELIETLPPVFGLDWRIALMRMQKKEVLDAVLSEFEDSIDIQADELQRYRDLLPDTIDDYRIMVHGMKSASASVGIFTLSGMAAVLERAASEKDTDTIETLHDLFIKEWRSYKKLLGEYNGTKDEGPDDKEEIKEEILKLLLKMLKDAMEEMDIDGADDAVKKLSSFKLPEEVESKFDKLKRAVADLDQDEVSRILSKIRGTL